MLRLDCPIEQTQARRVETLRGDYLTEQRRRHVRKCLFSVLLTAAVVGTAVLAIHLLENARLRRTTASEMEQKIREKDYSAAQRLLEQLHTEHPALANDPKLLGIAAAAKKAALDEKDRHARADMDFERMTASLRDFFNETRIAESFVGETLAALEKLRDDLSQEQLNRLSALKLQRSTLLRQRQKTCDDRYDKEAAALLQKQQALNGAIATAPSLDAVAVESEKLRLNFAKLAIESVTPGRINAANALWKTAVTQFDDALRLETDRRAVLRMVQKPASIYEFFDALGDPIAKYPNLQKEYETPARLLPVWHPLVNAGFSESTFRDPAALTAMANGLKKNSAGPLFHDFFRSADYGGCPAECIDGILSLLKKLQLRWTGSGEPWELVLFDKNRQAFYFYCPEPPRLEKKLRRLRGCSFDVRLKAAGQLSRSTSNTTGKNRAFCRALECFRESACPTRLPFPNHGSPEMPGRKRRFISTT